MGAEVKTHASNRPTLTQTMPGGQSTTPILHTINCSRGVGDCVGGAEVGGVGAFVGAFVGALVGNVGIHSPDSKLQL